MSGEFIGLLGIIVLLALLFMGVPVLYVLAFVGFVGYVIVAGSPAALSAMGITFFSSVGEYGFTVVPLFLIMGYFMYYSGVIPELFVAVRKWVGHLPGGLAIATILGGAGMGTISGSGIASTATLAKVTIPEMIKGGVDKRLAYGVVASAGPLAQMIPPSTMIVMYAIIAEQPIGKMLIAGLLPGILIAILYVIMVAARVKFNPQLAVSLPKAPISERVSSLKNIWSFMLLGVVIIGGIYFGVFTPTEAGAIAAFVAMCLAFFMKKLNKNAVKDSLLETVKTTSMVFMIVGTAFIFGQFLSVTRVPVIASEFLTSLPFPPVVILIGIIIMYLILGMFFDMLAAMFITLPIILPVIEALGYDPIWFGILMVFLAEIALVTPPLGLSLFIIKGAVPDSDINDVIRGSIPFIVTDLIAIALFILFPEIVTLLPSLMEK